MGGGAAAAALLVLTVGALLIAQRHPTAGRLFRWLPLPVWCYGLPLIAVTVGWLPRAHPVYRALTDLVMPIALALLSLGVNLPAVMRTSRQALLAAVMGAAGIVLSAPLGAWLLRDVLPPEAWKGVGALAGTWTGGSMNLLALRAVLQPPEAVFAPLIVVDAVIAYSWMALLVDASAFQEPVNRWLRAQRPVSGVSEVIEPCDVPPASRHPRSMLLCVVIALLVAGAARVVAPRLPTSALVTSSSGWMILLVTTAALGLSLHPPIRRLGAHGAAVGYPCLYLVLAAIGAQGNLNALWSAPAWLLLGVWIATCHGAILVLAGRWLHLPLGVLATASQANIGGVVSAPMVGAVYHRSLAPVGLLLAMAGNAVGTYLGLAAAVLARVASAS